MIIKGLLKRLFNDYWKGGRGRMIKYDYLLIINIWLLEVYSKSIEGLSIDYPEMIIERLFEDYSKIIGRLLEDYWMIIDKIIKWLLKKGEGSDEKIDPFSIPTFYPPRVFQASDPPFF